MVHKGRYRVLVVDDEDEIVELYAAWLAGTYEVLTATSGEEALETLDSTVDVVVLDRRMRDMIGDDVVEEIRRMGVGCRVILATAISPDTDIINLQLDEYLVKPITKDELIEAVRRMVNRLSYSRVLQEYFALASKLATLEASVDYKELAGNEEYSELRRQVSEAEENADATLKQLLEENDATTALRDVQNIPFAEQTTVEE